MTANYFENTQGSSPAGGAAGALGFRAVGAEQAVPLLVTLVVWINLLTAPVRSRWHSGSTQRSNR